MLSREKVFFRGSLHVYCAAHTHGVNVRTYTSGIMAWHPIKGVVLDISFCGVVHLAVLQFIPLRNGVQEITSLETRVTILKEKGYEERTFYPYPALDF